MSDRLDERLFRTLYASSLVYNTCWEDPAVDRQAFNLTPEDVLLVITSAGCNVLDYALLAPKRIHAVDANPRQTALLELKIAGIRALAFDDFYAIFGDGYHAGFEDLYRRRLRGHLSPFAQAWWDRHHGWFTSARGSFYFHGLSGVVARGVRAYFRSRPRLREAMADLFDAPDLVRQRAIYDERVAPLLWNKAVNWAISRQLTMSLIGVPYPQRRLVEAQHVGGV